jgi:molybdenum cofactor cytidylyltransferase
MSDAVVGVVLGAGLSTRLGRPKQLLAMGDTTLLGWAVREAERSSLALVVVVVGDVEFAPSPTSRAIVVRNDAPQSGCVSSLRVGLDTADAADSAYAADTVVECDAVMLLLGDMPGADADVIDSVLDRWHRSRVAVTEYRDGLGHPLIFPRSAFPTLRSLHGDKAVWKLIDADDVERVPIDRPRPRDVDTWDDYLAVCHSFGVPPQLQSVT